MRVHQVLSGAGPVDAVTLQALAWRRVFERWGWSGQDVAALAAPGVDGRVQPLGRLRAAPDDVLVLHYSAYAPGLRELLALPNPVVLVSHNVTPPEWFWEHEPYVAVQCAVGRRLLGEFARAAEVAVGVSAFNAGELAAAGARDVTVVPILFDPAGLPPPAPPPPGPPRVLFVGRIAPHKRHDEIVRVFARYRNLHAPGARLVLVGEALTDDYGAALAALARRLAPGAVEIAAGLPPDALWTRYRQAHAFLCLSEHEGFCIPLLEAFHFEVPVVARPVGGVPEVTGDAALLVPDRDPDVVAELLHLAVSDAALRAELGARGRRRLHAYAPGAVGEAMRAVVLRARAR